MDCCKPLIWWISKRISKYGLLVFRQKKGAGTSINEGPAQKLHKPVIKKEKYDRFKDTI